MATPYKYIERAYGVSPQVGERVYHPVTKKQGEVRPPPVGQDPQYVQVRFDGSKHSLPCHPTEIQYLRGVQ